MVAFWVRRFEPAFFNRSFNGPNMNPQANKNGSQCGESHEKQPVWGTLVQEALIPGCMGQWFLCQGGKNLATGELWIAMIQCDTWCRTKSCLWRVLNLQTQRTLVLNHQATVIHKQ